MQRLQVTDLSAAIITVSLNPLPLSASPKDSVMELYSDAQGEFSGVRWVTCAGKTFWYNAEGVATNSFDKTSSTNDFESCNGGGQAPDEGVGGGYAIYCDESGCFFTPN